MSRVARAAGATVALLALGLVPARSVLAQGATRVASDDRWVGADKLKHFFLGFFVQSVAYSVTRATGAGHGSSIGTASAATAVVSLGKEWRDRRTSGFSLRDLAWDAAGGGAATLLLRRTAR